MDAILNAARMLEELTSDKEAVTPLATPLGAALKKISVPSAFTKTENIIRGVKASKVAPPAWKKYKSSVRLTSEELALRPAFRQTEIIAKRKNREGLKLLCMMGDVKALCAKMKQTVQDAIKNRTDSPTVSKYTRTKLEEIVTQVDKPETHESACAQIYIARDVLNKKEAALQTGVPSTPGQLERIRAIRELTRIAERPDVIDTALKALAV